MKGYAGTTLILRLCATALVFLGLMHLRLAAQPAEPPPPDPNQESMPNVPESNMPSPDIIVVQPEMPFTNEAPPANDGNQPRPGWSPGPQGSAQGRSSWRREERDSDRDNRSSSRRRSDREGSRDNSGSPPRETREASSGETNRNGGLSFNSFRIVAERNIFDPTRRGARSVTPRERPKTVESLALVGIMRYEKGTFAFFDGTSSAYRKALKLDDTIAHYRVAGINSSTVQLATGTNIVELQVGMRLKREDQGPWVASKPADTVASRSESSPGTSSSSGASSAPSAAAESSPSSSTAVSSGGSDDEVIRRMRERRERE